MHNTIYSETTKGYLSAGLAALSFGSSGLFVKLAQQTGLESLNLLIVQHLISVPILWIITFAKHPNTMKLNRENLIRLFFLGAFFSSLMNFFYYQTFKYLDISIATIIFYTYPIILALFTSLFLKQKLSRLTLLSLFIAFIGCILVLNIFNTNITISTKGVMFGFSAAFLCALFSMLLEKVDKSIPPLVFITYSTSFALVGYLIIKPPVQLIQTGITGQQLLIVTGLAFICQVPPNILLYIAVKSIGAVRTSVVSNIEIPSAAILGYIFFNETLNLSQGFGMVLVISGIVLMKNGDLLLYKLKRKY